MPDWPGRPDPAGAQARPRRTRPRGSAAWARESAAAILDLLGPASRARGEVLLARADELLGAARAEGIADGSDLLPAGLTRRLAALAGTLCAALRHWVAGPAAAPDEPRVRPGARRVEQAWGKVAAHRLAGPETTGSPPSTRQSG